MPWWTVRYLETGTTYNSDMIPFKLLPDLEELNLEDGHRFGNREITIETQDRIRMDLNSGAIWVDERLVAGVPDFERVLLRKRRFNPSNGEAAYDHIHVGLVNKKGTGYLVRITETQEVHVERYVVSAQLHGEVVR